MIEFRVLGPLEVREDGRVLAITADRQRVVLATLLLDANQPVSVEQLVDAIWEESPPRTARVTVQNYVRRLRGTLGADPDNTLIETTADGYLIRLASDQLDLLRFHTHVNRARSVVAGDPEPALGCYRAALALWRGEPLADLARSGWLQAGIARLADLHLAVAEEWAELELATGGAAHVVATLTELAARWPLRESLRAQLMRALHGSGRTADALSEYSKARTVLVDELGIEPGSQLLAAHRHVLGGHTVERAQPPTPAQLPPTVSALAGRSSALAQLDLLVGRGDAEGAPAGAIAAVSGTAGVGKTALAVHWARRVAHRFPGGQLYVNLRGYDPVGPPLDPAEALRGFLTALGVAESAVPEDVASQTALYRSLVASRRVLIVLDNARDAEQVRPLLPGAGGCVSVVTSRDQLLSLVAADGARTIQLDLLTEAESVALLRRRLGAARIDAEPGPAVAIVRHCARLPLALSIAAARILAHPQLSLSTLAEQLADPARTSLDVLRSGDPATELREVLSWSTAALDPEPARIFRLLGLHPGPDFTPEATAHLVDRGRLQTHAWLDELSRAQLLIEHRPGRYSFHDLLRAHAAELVDRHEPADNQTLALRRLFNHLLDTAQTAGGILFATSIDVAESAIRSDTRSSGEPADVRMDRRAARTWLRDEDRVLTAAIRRTAECAGLESYAWRLMWEIGFHRMGRGLLRENIHLYEIAVATSLRLSDRIGEGFARLGLGSNYTYMGFFSDGERELHAAHDLFRDGGNLKSHALAHIRLTTLQDRRGDAAGALDHSRIALALYEEAGDRGGVATVQNNIGWCLSRTGQHELALPYCVRALADCREADNRVEMAWILDSLGHIYLHLGRHAEAIESYVEAVGLIQEEERHLHLAELVWHLGDAYDAIGDHPAARSSWQRSLDLLEDLDHPNAAILRTKLAD
jgi:DNA-binding SARP family transcriptional activator/tetratricopeptide (TPR) repeat protein